MDRDYYATHQLTIAQHPSETDERMMIRIVAFALYANENFKKTRDCSIEKKEKTRVKLFLDWCSKKIIEN